MSDKEQVVMNYKELSMFLLGEAVKLTKEFLEDLHEENSPNSPFYFAGPEDCISSHKRIGEYLKYAGIAYDLWDPTEEALKEIYGIFHKANEASA